MNAQGLQSVFVEWTEQRRTEQAQSRLDFTAFVPDWRRRGNNILEGGTVVFRPDKLHRPFQANAQLVRRGAFGIFVRDNAPPRIAIGKQRGKFGPVTLVEQYNPGFVKQIKQITAGEKQILERIGQAARDIDQLPVFVQQAGQHFRR